MSEAVIFEAEDHRVAVPVRLEGDGTARPRLEDMSGSVRGIAEISE